MKFAGRGFKLNGQFVFNLIDQALPSWTIILTLDPTAFNLANAVHVTGMIMNAPGSPPIVPSSFTTPVMPS